MQTEGRQMNSILVTCIQGEKEQHQLLKSETGVSLFPLSEIQLFFFSHTDNI